MYAYFIVEVEMNNDGHCYCPSKILKEMLHCSIIMDRFTKSSYFILVRVDYNATKLARTYTKKIERLHRVLVSIVSDKGILFTSNFWERF